MKKQIKKAIAVITAAMCFIAIIGLSSCAKHEHSFENDLIFDENSHWRSCTDPECTEISEKEDHIWSDEVIDRNGGMGQLVSFCQKCKSENKIPLNTRWTLDSKDNILFTANNYDEGGKLLFSSKMAFLGYGSSDTFIGNWAEDEYTLFNYEDGRLVSSVLYRGDEAESKTVYTYDTKNEQILRGDIFLGTGLETPTYKYLLFSYDEKQNITVEQYYRDKLIDVRVYAPNGNLLEYEYPEGQEFYEYKYDKDQNMILRSLLHYYASVEYTDGMPTSLESFTSSKSTNVVDITFSEEFTTQPIKITASFGEAYSLETTFTLNAEGLISAEKHIITKGNNEPYVFLEIDNTYNEQGLVATRNTKKALAPTIFVDSEEEFSYDESGRLVSVTDNGKTSESYTYDENGRVLSYKSNYEEKEYIYSKDGALNTVTTTTINGVETLGFYPNGNWAYYSSPRGDYEFPDLDVFYDIYRREGNVWASENYATVIENTDGRTEREFDEDFTVLKESFRSADGKTSTVTEFIYDKKTKALIQKEVSFDNYDENGTNSKGSIIYSYNDKGALIGEYHSDAKGNPTYDYGYATPDASKDKLDYHIEYHADTTYTEYKYDVNYKLYLITEYSSYRTAGGSKMLSQTYILETGNHTDYFNARGIKTSTSYYDVNGDPSHDLIYTYYSNGAIKSITTQYHQKSGNNEKGSKSEVFYDETGLITLIRDYNTEQRLVEESFFVKGTKYPFYKQREIYYLEDGTKEEFIFDEDGYVEVINIYNAAGVLIGTR